MEKDLSKLKTELKIKRERLKKVGKKMDEYTREYNKLMWEVDVLAKNVKLEQEYIKILKSNIKQNEKRRSV